ncbi:MAG: NHL repeat-containing protein [Desulfobacteria bacterium]
MPPVGSLRTFFPLALLVSILFAGAAGCSSAGDGSIAVQLVYPAPPGAAAAARASVRAPSYATDQTDRIRIRVLGPHFAPIGKWFLRSDGRGEIGGIPPGTRISVEVDEYDNTAIPSDNAVLGAPLLGRGWCNGITLSPGEVKTVPIAMYEKGTIVTICGAPASGGSGTPGDDNAAGGILAVEAHLGNPTAVKAGPDDSIYVSSSAYRKVKRIDRYGYLYDVAGDGTHGNITPGAPAASSPIGAVQDIDIDPAGNLYLFNDWNQIVRVDNGVVNKLVYDNGVENSTARFNLAVVYGDLLFFVNYIDWLVYQMDNTGKSDFVVGSAQPDTTEPFDRLNYGLRAPSSITYALMSDSLIFADTDNNRIMRISLANGYIYYYAGYPGGSSFVDNIDASAMSILKPRVVDYNPLTGGIFFVDGGNTKVYCVDAAGKVHHLAGNGTATFSGDTGPATAAGLNDPRAIAVDSRGNAYIADFGNHAVRMVVGGALP